MHSVILLSLARGGDSHACTKKNAIRRHNASTYYSELTPDGFRFLVSSDPALRAAYITICKTCYQDDLGIAQIDVNFNASGGPHTLFITKNGMLIGGCAIYVKNGAEQTYLPLESNLFTLKEVLPSLIHDDTRYCEFSKLSILPTYRSEALLASFIDFKFRFCMKEKIDYLFVNAPYIQARSYRKLSKRLGFDFTILPEVPMPVKEVYSGLNKVVLSAMPFNQNEKIATSIFQMNEGPHAVQNAKTFFAA